MGLERNTNGILSMSLLEVVTPPFFVPKMGDFVGWIFKWVFKLDIHF